MRMLSSSLIRCLTCTRKTHALKLNHAHVTHRTALSLSHHTPIELNTSSLKYLTPSLKRYHVITISLAAH